MSSFPFVITFYSYKGGVGRSMALLNVAYTLVSYGRNVLVIDMDLEAPGISGFLARNKELARPVQEDIVDLLSLVLARARSGEKAEDDGAFFRQLDAPLERFAVPVADAKLAAPSLQPRVGRRGRLDVICADQQRDYPARLERLQLATLNAHTLERAGNAFGAYVRTRKISVPPWPGLESLESAAEVPYDYVLVDSRTGLTEASGLCVGPFSDRLIVFTGLNDQNIEGTRAFLETIGVEPREWFVQPGDQPWDAADPPPREEGAPRRLGPKSTLLVASPVPAGEIEYREQRLLVLKDRLGPVASSISYHPRLAIMETVFVRDFPKEYITREYRGLAGDLLKLVGDHAFQLVARSFHQYKEKERAATVASVLRAAQQNPDLGVARLRSLADAVEPQTTAEFAAFSRLCSVLTADGMPDREIGYGQWGNALSEQAKQKNGAVADSLFTQAYEKYAAALKLKPDYHEALNNWGAALSDKAKQKSGAEAEALFAQSYEKYAAALKLKPDLHEALNNWGATLINQAKQKNAADAAGLFAQAEEKLQQVEVIQAGAGTYNLACLAALRDRPEECRTWLEKRLAKGEPLRRSELEQEEDFTSVRSLPWFVEILSKCK
jgi:tetratricopeptide (TPR) repeat protein